MSLKASNLKANIADDKKIQREVREILEKIDDEIKQAHEIHKKFVAVILPVTFTISQYISNSDAQRIIYFNILTSLIDRGFNVRINLKPKATIFEITWFSKEELLEIELQMRLLAKHSGAGRKFADLDAIPQSEDAADNTTDNTQNEDLAMKQLFSEVAIEPSDYYAAKTKPTQPATTPILVSNNQQRKKAPKILIPLS